MWTEATLVFWAVFPRKTFRISFHKNELGYTLGVFSPTHLVTLEGYVGPSQQVV
jgi:hypothetical protein